MTHAEARIELQQVIENYLDTLQPATVPNTPVALLDDFGEWLKGERDDS